MPWIVFHVKVGKAFTPRRTRSGKKWWNGQILVNRIAPGTKKPPGGGYSLEQGGEADGARTRDLQRDRLAL